MAPQTQNIRNRLMTNYKLTLSVDKAVVKAFKKIYEGRNMSKFVEQKMKGEIEKVLAEVDEDDSMVYTNLERAYILGRADLRRDIADGKIS